jgi:hypothetical protein
VSDEELGLYVAALIERYVKLGLERKVLADIRRNVFTIGPPQAENPKLQILNPKSEP